VLFDSLCILGGENFSNVFKHLKKYIPWIPKVLDHGEPRTLRRLTTVPDKETKVRVVAILDYYSQTVLKPLHEFIFNILKKIPHDCTFSQGKPFEKGRLSSWETFHSIDLEKATDRFPIELIAEVLEGHLPREYVSAWSYTMVGLPFGTPHNGEIRYEVGNPMGAYSS